MRWSRLNSFPFLSQRSFGTGFPSAWHRNFTVLLAGTAWSFFSIFSGWAHRGAIATRDKSGIRLITMSNSSFHSLLKNGVLTWKLLAARRLVFFWGWLIVVLILRWCYDLTCDKMICGEIYTSEWSFAWHNSPSTMSAFILIQIIQSSDKEMWFLVSLLVHQNAKSSANVAFLSLESTYLLLRYQKADSSVQLAIVSDWWF